MVYVVHQLYVAYERVLLVSGVGLLLVPIVLVVSNFGTVNMGPFCRPILFTREMSMRWLQLQATAGCFLLVQMVRCGMLFVVSIVFVTALP